MSKQSPHAKYLKILSSIVICEGRPIINNQNYVLKIFFEQMPANFQIQFKKEEVNDSEDIAPSLPKLLADSPIHGLDVSSTKYEVSIYSSVGNEEPQWRRLEQLYTISKLTDNLQSWGYLLS